MLPAKYAPTKRCSVPEVAWLGLACVFAAMPVFADAERLPVKVVIAAMFERGQVTGDEPGELQFWVERLHLDKSLAFPLGQQDIFMNDDGVMAVLLGGGIANATASVMALGLDPRFDLSNTYWLVAGIAGGDPADISLGSAAWARHVVDGDLLYEIDGREIPDHWPYGMVPLGASEPADDPEDIKTGWTVDTISFSLNEQLVEWAYSISKNLRLADSDGIATSRDMYVGYPQAQRPPFVTKGDTLSSSTYWHGELLNHWANDWVKLYAGTDASFMTSNMEDSGTLTALRRLGRSGYVDTDRVLVLRTVSNYTMPPPGKTAQWSRTAPFADKGLPALESAFVVGNTVVQALLANWPHYAEQLPQADDDK
ncbi:MAG: purine nucleoside permease [Gammaproteobacteria bacterium]|nr:purine nucleoside permease [Gammaproteobacteria bacterium]MDH3416659.1 purine nucleoside permease [Gammaproteobacteria bacterium]